MVSTNKRKGLPTKTRNIDPLFGSEINTFKEELVCVLPQMDMLWKLDRVRILARGFDRHGQKRRSKKEESAKGKATFKMIIISLFEEKQNLIFANFFFHQADIVFAK